MDVAESWFENLSKTIHGRSGFDYEIHGIAVGTGSGSTNTPITGLDDEVYRSNKENSDCYFNDAGSGGDVNGFIEVTAGGTTANIPADTEITELMVFALNRADGTTTVVAVEEFGSVTIGAGETETFKVEEDYL